MKSRTSTLDALVNFSNSLEEVKAELQKYPWDCDHQLVILTREHIASVLDRYLRAELTERDIEEWANLIEGRDDIGFERNAEELVAASIDELANPFLRGELNQNRAHELKQYLRDPDI